MGAYLRFARRGLWSAYDRLTHHVHILEMNGESYRLATSKKRARKSAALTPADDSHHGHLEQEGGANTKD